MTNFERCISNVYPVEKEIITDDKEFIRQIKDPDVLSHMVKHPSFKFKLTHEQLAIFHKGTQDKKSDIQKYTNANKNSHENISHKFESRLKNKYSDKNWEYKPFFLDRLFKLWIETPAVLDDYIFSKKEVLSFCKNVESAAFSFQKLEYEFSQLGEFKNHKLLENNYRDEIFHIVFGKEKIPLCYTDDVIKDIVANDFDTEHARKYIEEREERQFTYCLVSCFKNFCENRKLDFKDKYVFSQKDFFEKYYSDEYTEKLKNEDTEHYKTYIRRYERLGDYLDYLNKELRSFTKFNLGFEISKISDCEFQILRIS